MTKRLILLSFFLPVLAFAHGSGGTFETTIDEYKVDIGYTPEFIDTDNQVRLDFSAYEITADPNASTTEFTDVWVRVSQGNNLYFAGNINKPEFGPTGFSTVLSEPGEYDVFARFQANGESLVEVNFPLTVDEGESSPTGYSVTKILAGAAALLVGLMIGFIVGRRRV